MATITTDTFLDAGTARTAGESWSISSGAALTIRTDTRWHAGSPAGMLGTLGSMNISSSGGGGFIIDGTNVRWVPFTGGAGTVPPIGTNCVGEGGGTGYLLGVWPDLTSAPAAVGSAMPSTGFLKFREISGVGFPSTDPTNFAAGGIGWFNGAVLTSESTRTGWIEVVFDSTFASSCSHTIGLGYQFTGDWFYLGETNGTPGQTIQGPTNGAGNASMFSTVQVETAPGSGVYTWWSGVHTTPWSVVATRPTTDNRTNLYQVLDNGLIRFGSDGTSNVGYTPPAGCKVRTPNIILRAALSASRNLNHNNYSGFTTAPRLIGLGKFNIVRACGDLSIVSSYAQSTIIEDFGFTNKINCTYHLGPISIKNVCKGDNRNYWEEAFAFNQNASSVVLEDLYVFAYSTGSAPYAVTGSQQITATRLKYTTWYSTVSSINPVSFSQVTSSSFTDCEFVGQPIGLSQCANTSVINFDYVERASGDTTTSGTSYFAQMTSCTNCTYDGWTWGKRGTIAQAHPRSSTALINISGNTGGNRIRNFGTVAAPLNTGTLSSTRPARLLQINAAGDVLNQTRIQRIFVTDITNMIVDTDGLHKNFLIEQIYATNTTTGVPPLGQGGTVRALYGTVTQPTSSAAYVNANGVFDMFTSTTAGKIVFGPYDDGTAVTNFTPPSAFNAGTVSLFFTNDYVILETPYFVKGHTGFANIAPSISASSYIATYAIDTGSGYSAFKTLNTSNLISETISPTAGFKMKVKIQSTSTSYSNYFGKCFVFTLTTPEAQAANLYPLEVTTLSFEGLQPGSEVRAYVGTDPDTAVEIGGIESVPGDTWSFSHESAGQAGYIAVFALGFDPLIIPRTYASVDSTLLISQISDRTYLNPV